MLKDRTWTYTITFGKYEKENYLGNVGVNGIPAQFVLQK